MLASGISRVATTVKVPTDVYQCHMRRTETKDTAASCCCTLESARCCPRSASRYHPHYHCARHIERL
eukprot:6214373-Pleurochrysis_carterae.AAC.10